MLNLGVIIGLLVWLIGFFAIWEAGKGNLLLLDLNLILLTLLLFLIWLVSITF